MEHYAGSIAYGTNTPDSDTDIRGIFCAEPKEIRTPFFTVREKVGEGEDTKLFELSNYMSLYTQANPNILETLWVDHSDIIIAHPAYKILRDHRQALLSTKVAFTFTGYAYEQMKRIKGHNKWISNPQPKDPPRHSQFVKMIQNYTDDKIFPNQFKVSDWGRYGLIHYSSDIYAIVDDDDSLPRVLTNAGEFNITSKQADVDRVKKQPMFIIKYCADEYKKAKEVHRNYWQWVKNRNKKRSELEAKYGYDTKHAHHLVRLLRMGEEILTQGEVIVKRPDAEELKAIRNGEWAYEELLAYAEEMDDKIRNRLYYASELPKKPNIKLASKVLMDCQDIFWRV